MTNIRENWYLIDIMGLQELKFDSIPASLESSTSARDGRKTYYQLQEGIYLVPGVKRGAVCDTVTGNVYSINETAKRIILGEIEDPEFLEQLGQMNLMNGEPIPKQRKKYSVSAGFCLV